MNLINYFLTNTDSTTQKYLAGLQDIPTQVFSFAIRRGDLAEVQRTLEDPNFDIDVPDIHGVPPILRASVALKRNGLNAPEILRLILDKGPKLEIDTSKIKIQDLEPYMTYKYGSFSPLGNVLLIQDRDLKKEFCLRFLELGQDPRKPIKLFDPYRETSSISLIHQLLLDHEFDAIQEIVSKHKDKVKDLFDLETLYKTMILPTGTDLFANLLLCPGIKDTYDELGRTLLHKGVTHMASQKCSIPDELLDKMGKLISLGARIDAVDLTGMTPLSIAEEAKLPDLANKLRLLDTAFPKKKYFNGNMFSERCVYVGGGTAEFIEFDPKNSPLLQKIGEEFIAKISKDPKPVSEVLTDLVNYIRDEVLAKPENGLDSDAIRPFIPIDKFLEKKLGVCRHFAFVTTYILQQMIERGILKGQCYIATDKLKGRGYHAWSILLTESEAWNIQTYWNKIIDGEDEQNASFLRMNHGVEKMEQYKADWKRMRS